MSVVMRVRGKWVAFALGSGVAALTLVGWRVPGGSEVAGAAVALSVARSDALDIQPAGAELATGRMRPSGPENSLDGTFEVRNATAETLAVSVRAVPDARDLDRVLALQVRVNGTAIFEGSLAELHRGTSTAFVLASRGTAKIVVSAWIPGGRSTGTKLATRRSSSSS
jgi:hypothetical protein